MTSPLHLMIITELSNHPCDIYEVQYWFGINKSHNEN